MWYIYIASAAIASGIAGYWFGRRTIRNRASLLNIQVKRLEHANKVLTAQLEARDMERRIREQFMRVSK